MCKELNEPDLKSLKSKWPGLKLGVGGDSHAGLRPIFCTLFWAGLGLGQNFHLFFRPVRAKIVSMQIFLLWYYMLCYIAAMKII